MVAYVLPLLVAEVREYVDQHRGSLAAVWSDRLNREAALKVAAAPAGIQKGHQPNAKRVGDGFMSTGLILALTAEFTLGKTVSGS